MKYTHQIFLSLVTYGCDHSIVWVCFFLIHCQMTSLQVLRGLTVEQPGCAGMEELSTGREVP